MVSVEEATMMSQCKDFEKGTCNYSSPDHCRQKDPATGQPVFCPRANPFSTGEISRMNALLLCPPHPRSSVYQWFRDAVAKYEAMRRTTSEEKERLTLLLKDLEEGTDLPFCREYAIIRIHQEVLLEDPVYDQAMAVTGVAFKRVGWKKR